MITLKLSAQAGLLKTEKGLMAFFSSNSCGITLQLNEPINETPSWLTENMLEINKDIFYLQIVDPNELNISTQQSPNKILEEFKIWETRYIDSLIKKDIKKSKYINDTIEIPNNYKEFHYNAWYYFIIIDDIKYYFYFMDIFHQNIFYRYEFNGILFADKGLEAAQSSISECLKNMYFYSRPLNIEKLQTSVKSGKYYYEEK